MCELSTFESTWNVPDTWQQGRGAWGGLLKTGSIMVIK